MSEHTTHRDHGHQHGSGCGHRSVRHEGHVDYVHDGHLHNLHEGHVDDHVMDTGVASGACEKGHACKEHDGKHRHSASCGHERLPHGDHVDYLVGSHLHHVHEGHCDDHGRVQLS